MKRFVILFLITWLIACQKDEQGNQADAFRLPAHFPQPVYNFETNPFTKEGFELGKKLFYDPILSVDSTVSCGTCHAQVHGFADHNTALSFGIHNRVGARNAPPIYNLLWKKHFMWDGGINHIEVMPVAPITDPNEMGESMFSVTEKLSAHKEYQQLFKKIFKKDKIDDQQLLHALAQFQSMIISADSKYDKFILGKAQFTSSELAGLAVFNQKCSNCHKPPLFTDFSFRNNGLDVHSNDPGRARITLDPNDHGKFSVPSLRNIAITNPYMHDGRFQSLKQVLDFYADAVINNEHLDPELKLSEKPGIPLTEDEKSKLLAFLFTLTDYTFLSNTLYSEP